MLKKLIIGIFFCCSSNLLACDQKDRVLSETDHAFLKKGMNLEISDLSNNYRPLSLVIIKLDFNLFSPQENLEIETVLNHLQSAKNILEYLRYQKSTPWPPTQEDQIDYCETVLKVGFCNQWFVKNDKCNRAESRFFFHMIPYGVDIESFSSKKEDNIFPYICEQLSQYPAVINKFLYHYKPVLNSDTKTKKSCLAVILSTLNDIEQKRVNHDHSIKDLLPNIEDDKKSEHSSFEIDFKDIITPYFYEVHPAKVVRHDYKNIQSKQSIKAFLLALNAFKKEKKLIYLKSGVIKNCILKYIVGMPITQYKDLDTDSFLNYCRYVEKQLTVQYDDILKKDPQLLPPFIATKEQFIKLFEQGKK